MDSCINSLSAEGQENPRYLSEQLITYIGSKRSLLHFIGQGIDIVKKRLGKKKLVTFDVFSGSGIVTRYLKRHSSLIISNDLEEYASVINRCYLTNVSDFHDTEFIPIYSNLIQKLDSNMFTEGIISRLYAPRNDKDIRSGERVFYTRRNAAYLDSARVLIDTVPESYRPYFIAPLLSEASIHTNTAGVFKGFYKNPDSGIGQFGGKQGSALDRITGNITLPYPVFSNSECEYKIISGDASTVCEELPEVDAAYIDPPYNQHPYGSNYFMLNLLCDYTFPVNISEVSGIPTNWKRSMFNQKKNAGEALRTLIEKIKARFLLISFNSEGFLTNEKMLVLLNSFGRVIVLETPYNTYRGSRNLNERNIHIKEYLYLLEKN